LHLPALLAGKQHYPDRSPLMVSLVSIRRTRRRWRLLAQPKEIGTDLNTFRGQWRFKRVDHQPEEIEERH